MRSELKIYSKFILQHHSEKTLYLLLDLINKGHLKDIREFDSISVEKKTYYKKWINNYLIGLISNDLILIIQNWVEMWKSNELISIEKRKSAELIDLHQRILFINNQISSILPFYTSDPVKRHRILCEMEILDDALTKVLFSGYKANQLNSIPLRSRLY